MTSNLIGSITHESLISSNLVRVIALPPYNYIDAIKDFFIPFAAVLAAGLITLCVNKWIQNKKFVMETNYDVFSNIQGAIDNMSNKISSLSMFLFMLKTNIFEWETSDKLIGFSEDKRKRRKEYPEEYRKRLEEAISSHVEFLIKYESREIFLLDYRKMKDEINWAIGGDPEAKDKGKTLRDELYDYYSNLLAAILGENDCIPKSEKKEALLIKSEELSVKLFDIGSYLFDMRINIQNHLFGDYCKRKIPLRSPKDNKLKVLTKEGLRSVEKV